ncbi:pyrophosphohydrolase domain-containing protein [Archaeoglobus sp.]
MDYWEVADKFSREMYRKYLRRVDRPGNTPEPWKDFSMYLLIKRLFEEIEELKEAVSNSSSENIMDELLDVANFCMFLWAKLKYYS